MFFFFLSIPFLCEELFKQTRDLAEIIKRVGFILPTFCMGDCLRNFALVGLESSWGKPVGNVFSWDVSGRNFFALGKNIYIIYAKVC